VLERQNTDLSIRVRHPRYTGSTLGAIPIALSMIAISCGFFGSILLNMHSPGNVAVLILLACFLSLLLFLFVRSAIEEQTGEQFVRVEAGVVRWGWQTKWWTRERTVRLDEVDDVRPRIHWDGFGTVDLFTRRYRFKILERVLAEDAMRFAAELKRVAIADR
jgi:hypothetical protein